MKEYILINEQLLKESLPDMESDVDFIYNKYFKADIDDIQKTGIITPEMFPIYETDTSVLPSADAKKGHDLNPCNIVINSNGGNNYFPAKNLIRFGIHTNIVRWILEKNGDINAVAMEVDKVQRNRFLSEFKSYKIKGTIHHELHHWIDNTINNRYMTNLFDKTGKVGHEKYFKGKTVHSSPMERQGQIGNIIQLKKYYSDMWDELSFNDVIDLSPSLITPYNIMSKKEKIQWIRDIKTRMHREGLLGKNMINS